MAKRLPAGQFRHLVTIERHTAEATFDTFGQIASSSTAYAGFTTRASIEPIDLLSAADELIVARQQYPMATHRIVISYYSTLDTTSATRRRVIWGSKTLNIQSILDDGGEHVQMTLVCQEER